MPAQRREWCGRSRRAALGRRQRTRGALLPRRVLAARRDVVAWARPEFRDSVDVLFIDEAGQMSLADVLAVSAGAKNLVLLGDPQQLEQPQQANHPPGTHASALEHLLAGAKTIAQDRGLFLHQTRRLHPDICRFTAECSTRTGLASVRARESGGARARGLVRRAARRRGARVRAGRARRQSRARRGGSGRDRSAGRGARARRSTLAQLEGRRGAARASRSDGGRAVQRAGHGAHRAPVGRARSTVDKFQGQEARW